MSTFVTDHIVTWFIRKNHSSMPPVIRQIIQKYYGGIEMFVPYNGQNIKLTDHRMTVSIKDNLFAYSTIYGNHIINPKNKKIAKYIWTVEVAKCCFVDAPVHIGIDSSPIDTGSKLENFADNTRNSHSFYAFGFNGRAYAQNKPTNGDKVCDKIQNNWRMKTRLILNVKKRSLVFVVKRWWSQYTATFIIANNIELEKVEMYRFAASMKYQNESVKLVKFEVITADEKQTEVKVDEVD